MISLILTAPSPPDSITGAVQVPVNTQSGLFTVTPNQPFTGIVSITDGINYVSSANIISPPMILPTPAPFNPEFLVFNNSMVPQTFTYTPTLMGYRSISISAPGATVSSSVWVFVSSPGYHP